MWSQTIDRKITTHKRNPTENTRTKIPDTTTQKDETIHQAVAADFLVVALFLLLLLRYSFTSYFHNLYPSLAGGTPSLCRYRYIHLQTAEKVTKLFCKENLEVNGGKQLTGL
jgi:hypothetical protein